MKKRKSVFILSRGNVIAIVAMFLLGLFSFLGQYLYSEEVTIGAALMLTLFEVSLLTLSIALAIKAKRAFNHLNKWKIIEYASLTAYVTFAFIFSSSLQKFIIVISEGEKSHQTTHEKIDNIEVCTSTLGGWIMFALLHLFIVLFSYIIAERSQKIFGAPPRKSSGGLFIENSGEIIKHTGKPSKSRNCNRDKMQRGISFTSFPPVSFTDTAYSSVFAPAEVKSKSRMLVQVYLHTYDETEKVKALAVESDKRAERRDYIPLQCKLKRGDKADVLLNIYGETLLMSDKKSIVWQGSFTKCSFDYFVPKDIDVDELSCVALLTVNDIPVGEMRFITKIVEAPRKLNPEIIAHKYSKVFISYAHRDEAKVKSFHEGLKLAGIDHFFDRAYLKTGDIFPQVIQDYINSADLFVLFWSENASKSEYVKKERKQALERAFPQVKPQQAAKLSIYPMSIEPRAELPSDMKDNYHFGEI